ncbi:MAG: 4-hydroxythreonine-4-phosphate dehydrogenase PdxA [Firmicutes bacterium]|jgi:4-hydroxythreonine-4-phosphate dehydrogenase|nr:4-hydroxythreonine-4-phosphate dehydrogenase PdxA [Bacillota bacterium]
MGTVTPTLPKIAITMGDPYGIGPEIIVKAAASPKVREACQPVIIGTREILEQAAELLGREVPACPTIEPEAMLGLEPNRFGELSAAAGKAAFAYIEKAVSLALAGDVDAITTAPIHKEAINLAGYHYSGHTEILAALTATESVSMMLVCGQMRVAHVTTHVALEDVPSRITQPRVVKVIDLFHRALLDLGIDSPKIAVAGLNPHSGEGGLFGRQELDVIIPAVAAAVERGYDVEGPIPPDTVFVKMLAGHYDGVVAMYHDQGHIPVKLLGFTVDPDTGDFRSVEGVNVTLGLPIIRTSVDHGTAFDIAGTGKANEKSLVDAVLMAATMARHGRRTRPYAKEAAE